jgi:hypothetical protein
MEPQEAGMVAGNGVTAEITWSGDYTGNVVITVTTENECGTGQVSEEHVVAVYNSLSINEIEGISSMKVFPNPTGGVVTLQAEISADLIITVRVSEMTGKTIYNERMKLQPGVITHNIDLGSYENGIYTLIIGSDDGEARQKIILNK